MKDPFKTKNSILKTIFKYCNDRSSIIPLAIIFGILSSHTAAKEISEKLNYGIENIQGTQQDKIINFNAKDKNGFYILQGTRNEPLIFNGKGDKLKSGAIEIQENTRLLLLGSIIFMEVSNEGYDSGAIDVASGGILRMELSEAGEEIRFENTQSSYDIKNGGLVSINVAANTRVSFGKSIHSSDRYGKLEIIGPGEVNIYASVVSECETKFINGPIITLFIKRFNKYLGRGGGGGMFLDAIARCSNNIHGDLYVDPKIPKGYYSAGTRKEYTYVRALNGAGEGNMYIPMLFPHTMSGYGYSVDFKNVEKELDNFDNEAIGLDQNTEELESEIDNYELHRRSTLEFVFEKNINIISGMQFAKITVENDEILSTKGNFEPIYFIYYLQNGAIEIKNGGEAYIVGSAALKYVKNSGRGAIDLLGTNSKLGILMPSFGDYIEFLGNSWSETADIYNANSSRAVEIEGVQGTTLKLDGGIVGKNNGSLIIRGAPQIYVGETRIEQHSIIFEGQPEIVFSPGGRIIIGRGGSISGAPIIKIKLSSEQIDQLEEMEELLSVKNQLSYEYLTLGENVDLENYHPIIEMSNIDPDGNFRMAYDLDFLTNQMEYKRRINIFPGRRILPSGVQNSKITVYAGQKVISYGSIDFSNINKDHDGEESLHISSTGIFELRLQNLNDVIVFGGSKKSNGVNNMGTLLVDGPGTTKFIHSSVEGLNGTLIIEGSSVLNVYDTKINQKNIAFGAKTTMLLDMASIVNNSNFDDTEKSNKILNIQESGSIEGTPNITLTLADDVILSMENAAIGEISEFRYITLADGVSTANFKPILSSKLKFGRVRETTDRDVNNSENIEYRAIKITFGGTEEEPDYTILKTRVANIEDVSQDVVTRTLKNTKAQEVERIVTFFNSLLIRNSAARQALEQEDEHKIRNVYAQYNPDSHIASDLRSDTILLQSFGDLVADRMVTADDFSPSTVSELLVAAAGHQGLAYGLLKDRAHSEYLLSRIWFHIFGSLGSQNMEEKMKTFGYGLALSMDHRFGDHFRIGLAYSLNLNSLEGDYRKRKTSIHSLSLYGDYYARGLNLAEGLHISTLMTGGFTEDKNNELSGSGNIIYLAPTMGYIFNIKNSETLKLNVIPELGLRYSYIYRGKQKSNDNEVSAVTGNVLVLSTDLRIDTLFKNGFKLGTKFGVSGDIFSTNDNFYFVTLYDGKGYQILDETDKKLNLLAEFGINVGWQATKAFGMSISYAGKYSQDMVNNVLSFGVKLDF
jgi:hypothetical protein